MPACEHRYQPRSLMTISNFISSSKSLQPEENHPLRNVVCPHVRIVGIRLSSSLLNLFLPPSQRGTGLLARGIPHRHDRTRCTGHLNRTTCGVYLEECTDSSETATTRKSRRSVHNKQREGDVFRAGVKNKNAIVLRGRF